MKTSTDEPKISRRDFGKLAAGMGLASLSPFAPTAIKAEEDSQKLREQFRVKNGKSPIVIDESMIKPYSRERVGFRSLAFPHPKTGKKMPWYKLYYAKAIENALTGYHHPEIKADSIGDSRASLSISTSLNTPKKIFGTKENRGYMKWNSLKVLGPLRPENRPPDETDPDKLTVQAKMVARMAGADLVGVASLNRTWLYSSTKVPVKTKDGKKKKVLKNIVFKDVKMPAETDTELIIPDSVNNVIVMGIEMNRAVLQTAPSMMHEGAASLGYSRMAPLDVMLCEFIRSLGYIAIPSVNGVGMSVPMAVEAGLGQAGRHGTLITPEYGSSLRLTKVLTNMPLNHDKPIDFGVTEFCETCMKCARECPSKTITESKQSFEARTSLNQSGVLKWMNDYDKCMQYWAENGSSCGICAAVCPFTKGAIWVHKGVEFVIDQMRFMDPVMLGLDDAFGYGERRLEKDVWKTPMGAYGIDPDHTKNVMKGQKS